MSGRGRSLLAVLALAVFPFAAQAACEGIAPEQRLQNTPQRDLGRDLDRIRDEGWIEFAMYENFAPWSWAEGGKPRGIDVEIARLIAEDLGVTARIRLVTPGETLDADLLNYVYRGAVVGGHVSDVMLHAPYDVDYACRFDQVVFTGQYATERLAIAYKPADYPEKGPTPPVFRYDPVGVENDSISDFYLTSLAHGATADKVHRYPTTAAAIAGLSAGEVMAVMGPRAEIDAALQDGEAVHEPPLLGLARNSWTLGVAISFQHRPLAYAVDDSIAAALEDGRIEAIFADYGADFRVPLR
ncbi:ABC-type amino acid transport substrate-binding protein [Rhodobacter aestuarii]|uniref:ABC-type amino acid transport substrate-binding protein n=1 Tax=Rhodobacter aestuarii TaxID=453582 RepID=A0A1N7IWR2_9RHOB|nr:transporter substrate-binding domain-containing protein [Rhodobacter aestuarii]PTV97460.1 ABC-type amino acid transport substrate-binding protein [Rhodobacter aestuarii]SIS41426.1 ABC-type amino acid transport substrate-binding protein [Rhodobacter aestuarii]